MDSTTENAAAGKAAYARPVVDDYGSLQSLTADFDVEFVGSVTKLVTMAVASVPGGGGGDSPPAGPAFVGSPSDISNSPGIPPDVVTPGDATPDAPTGETLGETESGSGGPGGGGPRPSDDEVSGGGPGGGAGGAREEVGGGAGLPFTGYASWAAAGVGAAMTTSGVLLRDLLRRRR
jgi:hypothetical protein